ncbi:MAG: hypothetical protein A2Z47_01370 [Thermodesulfovibrio sp. RBG_19FT_COMBO_42_12]|nr:MAG: hypothetical protein A2Z47_01370 [Thermodesulfovibrio sp. RBG_19FT_COMBO_42_12]
MENKIESIIAMKDDVILSEYHGAARPGANGLSLTFFILPEAQSYPEYYKITRLFVPCTGEGSQIQFFHDFRWDGFLQPFERRKMIDSFDRISFISFMSSPRLSSSPSTSFKVRGKALRLDILTPQRKEESGPVSIPILNTAAQPMRYLDYLIENPEWGAVIDGGGVLVNVPNPARFAFHKLIFSRLREVTSQDKAQKDVMQASQVFSVLADDRPGDLILAWDEIKRRGRGWVKRASDGLKLLRKIYAVGI